MRYGVKYKDLKHKLMIFWSLARNVSKKDQIRVIIVRLKVKTQKGSFGLKKITYLEYIITWEVYQALSVKI